MTGEDLDRKSYDFEVAARDWLEAQRGGPLTGLVVFLTHWPERGLRVVEALSPTDVLRCGAVYERLWNDQALADLYLVAVVQPLPSETTEGSQQASPE